MNKKRMTPKEAAEELLNLMHDSDAFCNVKTETDSEHQPVILFRSRGRSEEFSMTIKPVLRP